MGSLWYNTLVTGFNKGEIDDDGMLFNVEKVSEFTYKLVGQPLWIHYGDCEEVKDVDTTKIDVHDVVEVAYVGEYAKKGFHLSEKYNWDFVEENGRMTIIPTEK